MAALTIPLILHVGAGSIGILSGAVALAARKGGRLHRASGTIFLIAMLVMAAMATWLAVQIHQRGNVVGGLFAFYLVLSGWMTIRRAPDTTGSFEILAFLAVLALALADLAFGIEASNSPGGKLEGYGAPLYYMVASVAGLAAALDLRVIRRGGISGVPRIARHLWRMCTALFIAAGSFFIGQQKVMPVAFHGSPVLFALGLAPLVLMLFWLVRVRFSRAFRDQEKGRDAPPGTSRPTPFSG